MEDRGSVDREKEPDRRPLCLVVSHSYLEPEIAKSLDALAAHLSVCLVTPRSSPVLVFEERTSDQLSGGSYEVLGFRRFPRRGALFLLTSMRLGLQRKPIFVVVEYDPWTPLFWQLMLARRLFAPHARVHLAVKKNTFRQRPRMSAAIKRMLAKAGLSRVSGVIAASQKAAELYRREFGVPAGAVHVVPLHPIDTAVFRPAPPTCRATLAVGFVGHVDSRKGADVLIRAVETLDDAGERVALHLIGPVGDVAADVERAVAKGLLRIHPPVDNGEVAEILRTLDVFVMPSARLPDHEEHDGRALLEAMACGLACVGSDSGIIPELLGSARGRIFPAGDAAALAEQLYHLLHAPEERSGLAERARAYVEREASTGVVALARFAALTGTSIDAEASR